MNRLDLFLRTRSLVRDLSNSFFRDDDLVNYINEGIERVGQVIPELREMPLLTTHTQEVTRMPKHYQHLLALYCAARLCTQDERHYQAGTFMNEFEVKLAELKQAIELGEETIYDEEGNEVVFDYGNHFVENVYYFDRHGRIPKKDKTTNLFYEEDGGD